MANFAIVLDPDTQRRSRFAAAICPEIAPVEGLLVNQRHQGALSVVWAAAPNAPVDIDQDGSGLAVVWGEAIAPDSARRQTAASLRTAWQTRPENLFDGFYAAFTYERQSGLTVGGDVLGFFPLYYWRGPDVVVICSSPELLRYHPDFTPRLCVDGLIGILLMRGIADSRCLWQGVTRLGAGDWLTVLPDLQVTTRQQYRIPCNKTDIEAAGYQNLFLEEQLEALTAALDRAIARHAPAADQQGLMLSGGLDSRMLAGFLHQQQATPQLLTFGRRDDLEVLCARSVAQTTGWSHLQVNPDQILAKAEPSLTQRCLDAADQLTRWDHLAGGGGSFAGLNWSEMAASIPIAPRMVTGLAMDRTICGTHVSPPTFEGALAYEYNRGGLSPAQLRQLFVKDDWLQGKITGVIDQLHQDYLSDSDVEAQRAWLMSLYHGNRFALGMAAWHLSFVAWPRLPVLDQQLLAVSGQLPGNTTASRYAQREIVKRSFPKLAALPLDHNDFRVTPLLASPVRKKLTLFNKTRQRWWRLQQRLGRDRRYYYRNFDINRPALQALRQRADAYRDKFSDIWDLSALQSLMPAQPKIPIQTDVILETKRCLTLTGALLWAGRNQ